MEIGLIQRLAWVSKMSHPFDMKDCWSMSFRGGELGFKIRALDKDGMIMLSTR